MDWSEGGTRSTRGGRGAGSDDAPQMRRSRSRSHTEAVELLRFTRRRPCRALRGGIHAPAARCGVTCVRSLASSVPTGLNVRGPCAIPLRINRF